MLRTRCAEYYLSRRINAAAQWVEKSKQVVCFKVHCSENHIAEIGLEKKRKVLDILIKLQSRFS